MTDIVDVLVASGARIRSIEEAAAAGDVTGWLTGETPLQARIRALVMAARPQRGKTSSTTNPTCGLAWTLRKLRPSSRALSLPSDARQERTGT